MVAVAFEPGAKSNVQNVDVTPNGTSVDLSLATDGLTGNYSGPEVLFWEIVTDLLEARFWIASDWPQSLTRCVNNNKRVARY